ncbi:MAG TPA: DUF4097 family beta strand repeat-containing protein [Acidimicrobiia bacterium]|nr:DUF4097 family beta strand repeat-containing protein [Acidimicrobiia bacterium]
MIEQSFAVGNAPRFVAVVSSGSIELIQGDPDTIVLHLESPREDDYTITQNGDTVTVRRPLGSEGWGFREASTRIRAEVPPTTTVRISVGSAEINAEATLADAFIDTASGDVSLREIRDAKIKSASGDLSIGMASGEVSLRTASGDVRIGDVVERLEVTTASGSVDVALARSDVASSAASGDLAINRFEGSDLDLKSASGNIRVGLPGGTKVALDARSLSGRIALPERTPVSGSPDDRRQIRAKLRTISGDIEIIRLD